MVLAFALSALPGAAIAPRAAGAGEMPLYIESVFTRDMKLRDLAELLTRGSGAGWKVLVSSEAGDRDIRFFLTGTEIEETLRALCAAYGLWYRRSPGSSIIQIMTREEYRRGISLYAEESVEVVPILYPSPEEIGDSLARLFQDRVVWSPATEQVGNDITRIENALDRMDTMASRATLVDPGAAGTRRETAPEWRDRRLRDDDRARATERTADSRGVDEVLVHRQRESEARQADFSPPEFFEDERRFRPGLVYISAAPMANALVLRSSDANSLSLVRRIIGELDRPRPQVLLEVKVLDIKLGEEQARGIDWLFQGSSGRLSGGMSRGITPDPGGIVLSPDPQTLTPRGSGLDPLAAVFSAVSSDVRARLQILQEEQRLRTLATPTLLVADSEASRIFIGSEVTVLEKVEPQTDYVGTQDPQPVTTYTVTSPRKRIGTTLLITPKIHADRTVTIRILQEETRLGQERSIKYGAGVDDRFTSQDVEETSVTTTILARDGHTIAIGGLIREKEAEHEAGVPGLRSLPLLGGIFRRTVRSETRSELLVLIQPHVLLAPGEGETVSREFLERVSGNPDAFPALPGDGEPAEDDRAEPPDAEGPLSHD